jgi:hypothetical protein
MKVVRLERRRLRRFFCVALTVATTMGSVASPARAQPPPPSASQLAEAKKFFDAGLALKKDGLFKEALASTAARRARASRTTSRSRIDS